MFLRRITIVFTVLVFFAACEQQLQEQAPATMTYEEALSQVEEKLPASLYMTNRFLPAPDAAWEPRCGEGDELTVVKIGFGWIANDEYASWYVADEKGWFQDMCISPEFVEGGPGAYPLQLLAGGAYDIGIPSGGNRFPIMYSSKTGAKPIAIGAQLKGTPYGWLGIDEDTPRTEVSPKRFDVKPEDFVGATVGLQPNSFWYARFVEKKFGLPEESIHNVKGGFDPAPLLLPPEHPNRWDFYGAWIMNQPRLLENQGYYNWVFFPFRDHGISGYAVVSAVMPEFAEKHPDLVRGYLAALTKGQRFVIDRPEEAAEITVEYAESFDHEQSKEMALRRFELEEEFVTQGDGLPILWMAEDRWNENVAVYVQHGQINLPE